MPYNDPDPQDPMAPIGVEVECPDDSATQTMAECFVEEFLRMGLSPDQILELFRQPAYAAAHRAYQTLGEEAVQELIGAYREIWRPVRIIDKCEGTAPLTGGSFPV